MKSSPRPFVICLTGFSGSGKSTIAKALAKALEELGYRAGVLDGDELRKLTPQIGYSREARLQSARFKFGHAAALLAEGTIPVCAFVLAFEQQRRYARSLLGENEFVLCHIRCPLQVCKTRDPKGLYARRQRNEIVEVVGIDIPYEEPVEPEVVVSTDQQNVEECVGTIIAYLRGRGLISP